MSLAGLLVLAAIAVVFTLLAIREHRLEQGRPAEFDDLGRERLDIYRTSQGRRLSATKSAGAAATARRATHGG